MAHPLVQAACGGAIVSLLGLGLVSTSGCAGPAAMAAMQAAGPVAMAATEHIVAAGGNASAKSDDDESSGSGDDDERNRKCEQLRNHPPGIEEIRRTDDLSIESREIRLERTGESYQWVAYRSRGSSPEGWRRQSRLDHLHFDPPLQYLLPDKKPRYLAYAASVADSIEDSEQMISVADEFGPKAGSFEWNDSHYTYTVSKQLPCFPEPDEQ